MHPLSILDKIFLDCVGDLSIWNGLVKVCKSHLYCILIASFLMPKLLKV